MFEEPVIRNGSAPDDPAPTDASQLATLETEICRLAGHLAAATCRFLTLVAEFDRCQGWAACGMTSCAAWLAWKCQLSPGTARERVRVARALLELPVIQGEFAAGRFSYSKARALTRIATADTEQDLSELAGPMTAGQLDRFARAHRTVTKAEDEQVWLQRRLTWRIDDDGSLRLSAHLPPAEGAAVLTALRAALKVVDPPPPEPVTSPEPEPGSAAQAPSANLADALVEVAETYLADRARTAGNQDVYQVIVHATPEALTAGTGPVPADGADPDVHRCHVEDGPAISPAKLRQIACGAVLRWMSHDKKGNALDTGRRRREPSAAMRRALADRDKGRCRFPGCHRRATQAHHIWWWLHGGPTKLDNLISLCGYHHRLIHQDGYQIRRGGRGRSAEFTFQRPDGELIPASPPLPLPDGPLEETHTADIAPGTIVPPWHGARLDLDHALAELSARQLRREHATRAWAAAGLPAAETAAAAGT